MKGVRQAGFSLIEMLIVILVLGILLGIGASSMIGLRKNLALDKAAQRFSQDLQGCRFAAMSKSLSCRLRITGAHTYVVERNPDPNQASCATASGYTPRKTRNLGTSIEMKGVQAGDCLAFNSRGFGHFALTSGGKVTFSNGKSARTVIPSLVGTVKIR